MNDVIRTCTNIFLGSDKHEWEKVENCFAKKVLVDYSSFTGQPPATISSTALIASWSGFLPLFKFTMHYLSNFEISVEADRAYCSVYGHAIHHFPVPTGGDLFEVYGTYDFDLIKEHGKWIVTVMKYNHKYSSGNLDLPLLAQEYGNKKES